ncbi:hypothetical protein [Actinopolymorpha pittospori]|uniref:Uncharacterized protein n=1 Tax=Actinopolymorpha pittospori TaxID=648752 RepID=A0A927MQF7_9ACTN|nr:hypothetical protein [Actinopolymorpha pittospori]MBE1605000.1 hypothetical protein [Actinopolymorpha pittospori]
MRIVTWILMGIGAGALAGFATGLLKRHSSGPEPLVTAYAGGYAAPVASADHTATQPTQPTHPDGAAVADLSDKAGRDNRA